MRLAQSMEHGTFAERVLGGSAPDSAEEYTFVPGVGWIYGAAAEAARIADAFDQEWWGGEERFRADDELPDGGEASAEPFGEEDA